MKKNYLLYFLLLALSTPIWVSCNDWTESEAKDYFEGPSEEYYAALRAYKKSDHPIGRILQKRKRRISSSVKK